MWTNEILMQSSPQAAYPENKFFSVLGPSNQAYNIFKSPEIVNFGEKWSKVYFTLKCLLFPGYFSTKNKSQLTLF